MKTLTLLMCSCLVAAALQAQVIRVPFDYPTIQQGIDAANPGDTVLVADGIYYEQISFLGKKPLLVASEFVLDGDEIHIANTVIDGTHLSIPTHASVVYFTSGEDSTSVLCGFTIREGKGTYYETTFETDTISFQGGGGIFISGSGAKITHNHITLNHLDYDPLIDNPDIYDGAGIATQWEPNHNWVVIENNLVDLNTCSSAGLQAGGSGLVIYCNAIIAYNTIRDNICTALENSSAIAGGLACATDLTWDHIVTAIVHHNEISGNKVQCEKEWANSGGVIIQHITGEFKNNIIRDNEVTTTTNGGGAAGMLCYAPLDGLIITGNTFSGNSTNLYAGGLGFESDAAYIPESRIVVENNYFLGNQAMEGGGIIDWNIPLHLQNNVFSGNQATSTGGAICLKKNIALDQHHMALLINNSFFGNSATSGGAIFSVSTKPLVINCIFNADEAIVSGDEIFLTYTNDTVEIANSNIDMTLIYGRSLDGGGNITADPVWEDTLLLTLRTESPCINSGIDSYTCDCGVLHECPYFDITGIARPYGGLFDMGAYEKSQFEGLPEQNRNSAWLIVYPNPASGTATFEYSLEASGEVQLAVYDLSGRRIAELVDGSQSKGHHKVYWNANGWPAGIYFYRLSSVNGQLSTSGKLVVEK